MIKPLEMLEGRSRPFLFMACLVCLLAVGALDYITGVEIYFSVFYLLGICLATWYISRGFGYFFAVLSVIVWMIADLAGGNHYSYSFIPIWNASILLTFYVIVVYLLSRLKSMNQELENRVRQRTQALTEEMAQRERLEKEILEVSEREQRRIGRDLHDGLCQHLTGTALAGQVLRERLEARAAPEAPDAGRFVKLVEDGITMARELARGTYQADMEAQGLAAALRELSANMCKWSKVACLFEYSHPVPITDGTTAMHLYRITQEAISNSIRHGKAKRIVVELAQENGRVVLTIEDDGLGLGEGWQKTSGMGTRIMAHRAAMIGADFAMDLNPTGGTFVKCSLPIHTHSENNAVAKHAN